MTKELITGMITGLIANTLGVYLYVFFFSKESINQTLTTAYEQDYLGKIIAIGAILNLIAFFIYIKKRQDVRARGVLFITLLIGISTMILKFI